MRKCILYILFSFASITSISQDILMSRDSTKIEAKVLGVSITDITYKRFNYQWGPALVVNKDEFAYVVYQTGQIEHFVVLPGPAPGIEQIIPGQVSVSSKNDSLRKPVRIGDYIKFSVYAGMVINSTYSNLQQGQPHSPAATTSDHHNERDYNYNMNLGFNFLLGKNKYVKPLISISYLRSEGEFDYKNTYKPINSQGYSLKLHYVSKIDFINLTTGLRFVICRHLCIEPLVSFNVIARADVRYTGTKNYSYSSSVMQYYDNVKTAGPEGKPMENTFSFCPRISYEFNIKQQPVGVYVSYNMAYKYRLPWYMVGVSYYPFKKLR